MPALIPLGGRPSIYHSALGNGYAISTFKQCLLQPPSSSSQAYRVSQPSPEGLSPAHSSSLCTAVSRYTETFLENTNAKMSRSQVLDASRAERKTGGQDQRNKQLSEPLRLPQEIQTSETGRVPLSLVLLSTQNTCHL